MFSGFEQLSHDKTRLNESMNFYEQFWGNPLPQEHKDSVPENSDNLLPTYPHPIINTELCRLFIRAEYVWLYNWVEQTYNSQGGTSNLPLAVVLTGQPGIGKYSIIDTRNSFFDTPLCIGKSLWAYYILHWHLGERSITLWFQKPECHLFCSEGVLVIPATFSFNRLKFSLHIWTIVDSTQSQIVIE
jgi:hypothetical protein